MFENYLAAEGDLNTITEALEYVWHPKLKFIFKDPARIEKTLVISYDSQFIYIWGSKPIKLQRKISHRLKIKDEWQYAWKVGLWNKKIENLLPRSIQRATHFEIPRISGGLLTPFIELQKKIKGKKNNPYITKESYLATILHEFGHVYWNSFKMWWPSNKKENLSRLRASLKRIKVDLSFPVLEAVGEIFAFCAEHYASSLFWPNHKEITDKSDHIWIKILIEEERKKNLEREDSVLEPTQNPHHFASVSGRIVLEKYPTTWPQILTDQTKLSSQI